MDDDLKAALFARKAALETKEVKIGTLVVVVRALSREEVRTTRDENASDLTYENRLVARALVVPAMDPVEVAQWLDAAPAGDSVAVMSAVAELSGMNEGADKSRVPRVRKQRR
jgi:hypothetical protein